MFRNGKLGLGVVTYNVLKDMDLETLISLCEKTGMDSCELRTTHAHGVEVSLSADERKAVRERFETSSLTLAALGSTCEFHSPDPNVVAENVALTRRFCQLAADVGALGVKVRPNGLPEGSTVEETTSRIAAALLECGKAAEDLGVRVFVEVHGPGTSDPVCMRRIFEKCPHPAVGATWNCNQADLRDGSISETFPLLRDRVMMVHTHDWYEDYPYRSELIPYLLAMGFDGYCMAETPATADPERVLRYYRFAFDSMVEACGA